MSAYNTTNTEAVPVPEWGIGPFQRPDGVNPILSPNPDTIFACPMRGGDVAWERAHVFNPAAVVRRGQICLLYRAEDGLGDRLGRHTSRLGLAESSDGLSFTRRPAPVLFPDDDPHAIYSRPGGCEDPRIVETEDGGYVVTYTNWDHQVARLSVAVSRDLVQWQKYGPVFADTCGGRFLDVWSKSGSIVTRRDGDHLVACKFDGRYWMYWGEGTTYAATSTDLVRWEPVLDDKGELLPVMNTRPGRFDSFFVEPGPPAVLTDRGIVLLYNGKNSGLPDGDPALMPGTYSAGQALFDPEYPSRVLARTDTPFLVPEAPYECTGQYAAGTVFIEGLVHFQNRWWLYYGTADSHVAVAYSAKDAAN